MHPGHIARVCHEANRAYCATLGDYSQPSWDEAPKWQRASACLGVDALIADPSLSAEDMHKRWAAHKTAEGWVYGPVKDAKAKTHPCLVPFDDLPEDQQRKDNLFQAIVRALAQLPIGYVTR